MIQQLGALRYMEECGALPPCGTLLLPIQRQALTWQTALVGGTMHISLKLSFIDRSGDLQLDRHRCIVFEGVA